MIFLILIIHFISNFNIVLTMNNFSINYYERQKRAILVDSQNLWSEKEIPYFVYPSIDPTYVKVALAKISLETCLIFRRQIRYNESLFAFLPGRYYETELGKRRKIPHKIFMPNCRINIGKITREALRALGLDYEHNRNDRRYYIRINYWSIKRGFVKYFTKEHERHTTKYGSTYDYRSIMHFSNNEYAKKHRKTIHSRDPFFESLMGKSQQLSFYDAMLVNKKYCSFPMIRHPHCQFGTYQHPITPHICKCLPFLSGNQCETIVHDHQHCTVGNIFFASRTTKHQTIRIGGKCIFFLRTSEGRRITLKLKFHVPNNRRYSECNERNSIEVKTTVDLAVSGFLFCPNGRQLKFTSPYDRVTLVSYFVQPVDYQLNITYVHF